MEKLTEFKIEDHLNSDEERVIFLRDCIESGVPTVVAAALGTIARSRNMAELSRSTGISRAGLYKSLSNDGNPTLSVLMAVLAEMNLKIDIVPDKVA